MSAQPLPPPPSFEESQATGRAQLYDPHPIPNTDWRADTELHRSITGGDARACCGSAAPVIGLSRARAAAERGMAYCTTCIAAADWAAGWYADDGAQEYEDVQRMVAADPELQRRLTD